METISLSIFKLKNLAITQNLVKLDSESFLFIGGMDLDD